MNFTNEYEIATRRIENDDKDNDYESINRIRKEAEGVKNQYLTRRASKLKVKIRNYALATVVMIVLSIYFGGMIPEEAPISEGVYAIFMALGLIFSILAIKKYMKSI